jgi:MtN3 and saliva related transmembrane protein
MPAEVIGYAATAVSCATMVPQIVKALRTSRSEDVSVWMVLMSVASASLWGAYGVANASSPLMLSGAVSATLAIVMLFIKSVQSRSEGGVVKLRQAS